MLFQCSGSRCCCGGGDFIVVANLLIVVYNICQGSPQADRAVHAIGSGFKFQLQIPMQLEVNSVHSAIGTSSAVGSECTVQL